MPNVEGINVSELVAPEQLADFLISCPLANYLGNLGEEEWKQRKYSPDMSYSFPYPNIFLAAQGLTAEAQAIRERYIPVRAQEPLHIMIEYNSLEEMLVFGGPDGPQINLGWQKRFAKPMIESLSVLAEQKIVDDMNRNYFMQVGTAGTPISSFSNITPINALWQYLELSKADGMIMLSPDNYSTLAPGLTTPLNPSYNGPILRDLDIPATAGWGLKSSEFIEEHLFGSCAEAAAARSVTVAQPVAEGSDTIIVNVPSGTGINEGDIFWIDTPNGGSAGSYTKWVSPRAKKKYPGRRGFVSNTTIAGATGTTQIAIKLSDPLYSAASGQLQNIDRMPTSGDVLTFNATLRDGDYVCTKNYVLIPQSGSFVGLQMPDIDGAENAHSINEDTQIAMRVSRQGVLKTSTNAFRVDLAAVWRMFPQYGVVFVS